MSDRSRTSWRAPALVAAVTLSVGVVIAVAWPRGEAATRSGPAPPCPDGFVEQLGRAESLRAALRGTAEGRALLDALGATEVRYCFGEIDVPVVRDDRVLVLSRAMEDAELAARAGHLLEHVVRGSPFPASVDASADCDRVVDGALAAEARAYALELRLRRALGVERPRYEFEAAFHAAPAAEGERVVLAYLRAHPDGGPGLDPLGTAYRQRCEAARADARRRRDPARAEGAGGAPEPG